MSIEASHRVKEGDRHGDVDVVNLQTRETVGKHSRAGAPSHDAAGRPRRRRLTVVTAAVALVVLAAGGTALALVIGGSQSARRATVAVGVVGSHTQITLTNGDSSIGELAATLKTQDKPGLVTAVPGGGWELRATVLVGARARLSVDGTPLLLLSDDATTARIIVQGGQARFVRTTVSSWTNAGRVDTDLSDGRSDVVAQGPGSLLAFDHARVVGLGANTDNPGVSIRQGASGTITRSAFQHCFRGLYAYKSAALSIEHSSFTNSAENGGLILSPGRRTRIATTHFSGNAANGLEVDNASGAVLQSVTAGGNRYSGISAHSDTGLIVTDAQTYENRSYGLTLTSSARSVVTGLRTFANVVGVQINGGTSTISTSAVSANSADGIFTTGPTTVLTAHGNRFDHNGGGGLWVANGRVTARANDFDNNRTGMVVNDATPNVTFVDNTITASSLDGIGLLAVPPAGSVTGNTVSGSSKAAISTRTKASVTGLLNSNRIESGQPKYRVRGN